MDINVFRSSEEAARALADTLSGRLLDLKGSDVPALFLFSGGSALGILDRIDSGCFGPNLTVAPIDERYDPSGKESNSAAFTGTDFFLKAEAVGTRFIDTRVAPGQGRDELTDAFGRALREWREGNPTGTVIALLGMGPDGHTAGIFPVDTKFSEEEWVVGYRAPEYATCPERVTVTPVFLVRYVDEAFAFVTGEGKRVAWERVIRNDEPEHVLPALIFHRIPRMEAFTDIVTD